MKIMKVWLSGILILCFLFIYCGTASAVNQQIRLKAGWNLISFAVLPADISVDVVLNDLITSDIFIALWTYDTKTDMWSTYPAPHKAIPSIENIEAGKGYWLKVTSAVTLEIEGAAVIPSGRLSFESGWNLVGFCTDEAKPYDRVFYNAPIAEIWKYDAASGHFKGVELSPNPDLNPPTREDFTQIEPGLGYWVYALEPFILEPVLGTAMESDKDMPPLLNEEPVYGIRYPWTEFTPGDEDIGLDGWYDRPDTQRAITFRDNMSLQNISIYNTGTGIMSWSARINDPENTPWLRFMVMDEQEGKQIAVEGLTGTVITDTARLELIADRSGLFPGHYQGTIFIGSNSGGDEPVREITVYMEVAGIEGDYIIVAQIDTVDWRRADDMHNPRLFLSLYSDKDGLKGIIDDKRTLLMPKRFYMTGQYYEDETNRFIISGGLELAEGDEDNPYDKAIRREITLIGDRATKMDAMLGPLDLKGEYRETIRNVLEDHPIYLAGTFTAQRIQGQPSTIDSHIAEGQGGIIPDQGSILEKTIEIQKRMIITEVDVSININHTRPADLIITLISPAGTEVRLRDRSTAIVGEAIYDTDTAPVDSLEDFNDEMSDGIWTLRIEDMEAGETGELLSWSLDIKGTLVYFIQGTVHNAGQGATVLLTGCGLNITTTTDASGHYRFDDLVNCIYRITASKQGYESATKEVYLNGQDISGLDLSLKKIVSATTADYIFNPVSGLNPLSVEFVDISPPAVAPQGCTYTWTFRKLIDGTPQPYSVRSNEGPRIIQVFDEPGTYISKMEIFSQGTPSTLIATVDKSDQYIMVGLPENGSAIFSWLTTAGGGAWYGNEDAFDSATFDIDRPPYGGSPNTEDSNYFTGEVDDLTRTNSIGINATIDGPAGPDGDLSSHAHIYVNIGQPIVGRSVSGNKVLLIGANP